MRLSKFLVLSFLCSTVYAADISISSDTATVSSDTQTVIVDTRPIRGIHVTAWSAGSTKYRKKLDAILKTSVINSVIIDIKEYKGEVYIPGVRMAVAAGAYVPAMPDLASYVADLNRRGIYTVARVVVFKDGIYPKKNPHTAVKNASGGIWADRAGNTWFDPYHVEGWRYNTIIALEAARMGFKEIQFDYIRFPTDGALSQMRFSKPYTRKDASDALVGFLRHARQALQPTGVKISIDVFGLTTTDNSGMGIGQLIRPMAEQVDYVCPMIYPSHYYPGEYGLAIPNNQPYKVIWFALRDAIKNMGPDARQKLRPYLQDFSLRKAGIPYNKAEVEAQIQASADHGILSWNLWNASSNYTWSALETEILPKHPEKLLNVSSTTVSASTEAVSSVGISTTPK